MEYHVSVNGEDGAKGTEEYPFQSISRAAAVAVAGDTITVHAGIYREWVNPENGGTGEARIVYRAAGDGETVITGAEPIKEWKNEEGNVWSTEVSNSIFTVRNPYKEELYGDWLFEGAFAPHLGDVYLDGKSLYECASLDDLLNPEIWPQAKFPEESLLKWYAQAGIETTKIWANFGGRDPRCENVEINVRPYCFWPEKEGRNYITVRGFILRQASPQWAPPTALQEGLIGPHWSKGWIIEDNIICESKCTGISLGKELGSGQNEWSRQHIKGGTQREQEVIFRALRGNWNKQNIGSHIVRNNIIHDCEQAGIVGHLGCVFSEIYKNRIYNIHHKRIFHGAEVGGIKLHASLDTRIYSNVIYGCYRGIWLDWQAQGTRISRNVFFDNLSEDFFTEVCHGPYMVDHNLFLSPMNFRNLSEGGAFVHNLFTGKFVLRSELSRYTPYHVPHETAVAGYSNISGGDDRFYNNIFIRDNDTDNEPLPMTFFEHLPLVRRQSDGADNTPAMDGLPDNSRCYLYPVGLSCYDNYPGKMEKEPWEYTKEEKEELIKKNGSLYKLGRWAIPVSMKNNLYFNNAVPSLHEPNAKVYSGTALEVKVLASQNKVSVRIIDPELLKTEKVAGIVSSDLGKSYHAEMLYENPDGSPICFDTDFYGNEREMSRVTPGPFEICNNEAIEFCYQ